jgi:hypothetical protein
MVTDKYNMKAVKVKTTNDKILYIYKTTNLIKVKYLLIYKIYKESINSVSLEFCLINL